MNKLPRIAALVPDDECSASLKKRAKALAVKIGQFQEGRAQLHSQREMFEAADASTFEPAAGAELGRQELLSLQKELELRREIIALDRAYRAELRQLAAAARTTYQETCERIIQAVRSAGFLVSDPPWRSTNSTLPHWIASHPEVAAAANRQNTLSSMGASKESATRHQEAIQLVERELDLARRRLLKI